MINEIWKPNPNAPLWYGTNETFFEDLELEHVIQIGPSCVPTTLAMIARATGADVSVSDMKKVINTQAPHTWSNALKPFGLQLAYCNNDVRSLSYFIDELVALNDLFLLSFYSSEPPKNPDSNGKLCTAHIVTMHKDEIIDTAKSNGIFNAKQYPRLTNRTKRIFRVVPFGHERCL